MEDGGEGIERPIISKNRSLLGLFRRIKGGAEVRTTTSSPTADPQMELAVETNSTPESHPAIERAHPIPQLESNDIQDDPSFENDSDSHQEEERALYVKGAEVKVKQKGRVIRLTEGGKANYLIDVTDRVEPNQQVHDPESTTTVRELYPEFEDSEFNDVRGSNNGIIVTVTNRFSPDREKRVYISHLGELVWDENDKGSFPDIEVLEKFDFTDRGHGLYVPWSFNSSRADEFFAKELGETFEEQEVVANLPALEDPTVIEADYSVK